MIVYETKIIHNCNLLSICIVKQICTLTNFYNCTFCLEQRLSALVVSILVGISVLMSPLLKLVPMAVLFGVFLYMGISSINGIQFFERMRLFFMPVKHHSQANYVRRVCILYIIPIKNINMSYLHNYYTIK